MRILWLGVIDTVWSEKDGWDSLQKKVELVRVDTTEKARAQWNDTFDAIVIEPETKEAIALQKEIASGATGAIRPIIIVSKIWCQIDFNQHSASELPANHYSSLPMTLDSFMGFLENLGEAQQEVPQGSVSPDASPGVSPTASPAAPRKPSDLLRSADEAASFNYSFSETPPSQAPLGKKEGSPKETSKGSPKETPNESIDITKLVKATVPPKDDPVPTPTAPTEGLPLPPAVPTPMEAAPPLAAPPSVPPVPAVLPSPLQAVPPVTPPSAVPPTTIPAQLPDAPAQSSKPTSETPGTPGESTKMLLNKVFSALSSAVGKGGKTTESLPEVGEQKAPQAPSLPPLDTSNKVLSDYLSVREHELATALKEKEKIRQMYASLEKKAEDLRKDLYELQHQKGSLETNNSSLNKKIEEKNRELEEQKDQLEFEKSSLTDKVKLLEEKLNATRIQYTSLKDRIQKDIPLIQEREKELESHLEIVKGDLKNLTKERNNQVLDLKKKITGMERDVNMAHTEQLEAETSKEKYVDSISRVNRAIQIALGIIEEQAAEEKEERQGEKKAATKKKAATIEEELLQDASENKTGVPSITSGDEEKGTAPEEALTKEELEQAEAATRIFDGNAAPEESHPADPVPGQPLPEGTHAGQDDVFDVSSEHTDHNIKPLAADSGDQEQPLELEVEDEFIETVEPETNDETKVIDSKATKDIN